MQTLFQCHPSFIFSRLCVLRYMKEEGTVPLKLAVSFDPVVDEEPELSLSITLASYQNAVIIMQLQMKEKKQASGLLWWQGTPSGTLALSYISIAWHFTAKTAWLRRLPADFSISEYMQITLKKGLPFTSRNILGHFKAAWILVDQQASLL